MRLEPQEHHPKGFRLAALEGRAGNWVRLVVLLGGILAVGHAARKLAFALKEAKIADQFDAVLREEERRALPARALVASAGYPLPVPGAPSPLAPSEAVTLRGKVVSSSGAPCAGARAEIRADRSAPPWVTTITDARGNFEFTGLAPGLRAGVWIEIEGPAPRSLWIESIPNGLPGTICPLGTLEPAEGVVSTNTRTARDDSAGAARARAWLDVQQKGMEPPGETPVREGLSVVLVDEQSGAPVEGRVLLDLYSSGVSAVADRGRFATIPEGEHRLLALAPGYLPRAIDLAAPLRGPMPIEVRLSEAASVRLRLEDPESRLGGVAGVRITTGSGKSATVALSSGQELNLNSLPPGPVRFELLVEERLAGRSELSTASLRRSGVEIARELVAGSKNARVVFHPPKASAPWVQCGGKAEPGSWIVRAGAHLDEPGSYCGVSSNGRWQLGAPLGSTLWVCRGPLRQLEPSATLRAGTPPDALATWSATVRLAAMGRGNRESRAREIVVRCPDGPLRTLEWRAPIDPQGTALMAGLPAGAPFLVFAADEDALPVGEPVVVEPREGEQRLITLSLES
ncbi:MAG: carboxypeptidase regulatory-like domain-containing protein [Planctomycetes bacterium]|nr:carboxypeptidase regulatory-like domain-containing protein [Planctomycetota bacterium]